MEYIKNYWLNEESRTFLSRGYITETPEEKTLREKVIEMNV
jgi:hypothetical protein